MKPHLEPLGLEGLADWFAFLALTGWVVVPLWQFVKQLNLTREDLKPRGRWRRVAIVFGIPLLAFFAFCFVPIEHQISRHGAVELAEPEIVHPETAGFIKEILVKEGDEVKPGTLLARLENRELTVRRELAAFDVQRYEHGLNAAVGVGKTDEIQQLQAMRDGAKAVQEKANRDVEQLELRAKTSGVVLTRDLNQRIGMLLRPPQDALCEIGSLDPMRIRIPLSEKEVRYVQPGNTVTLMADAYPGQIFEGSVSGEPMQLDPENFPPAFSKERGGDVPTVHDPATGREKLLEHTYVVMVEVKNPERRLRYGMTMRTKINTGKHPFGTMVLQWFTDLISLDYRF